MSAECKRLNDGSGPTCDCQRGGCAIGISPNQDGYPVRLTKAEARRLQKMLTMYVDYPGLEPEDRALFEKLEAVL